VILGISANGGESAAVLMAPDGSVFARAETQSVDVASALSESARKVLALSSGAPLSAVGLSLPDPDPSTWSNSVAALSQAIEATPRLPIHTVSVGNASALAEVWFGAGKGVRDLIAFSAGPCVSAGVISNGVLLSGAHGLASSVQWLALNPVEREDYRRLGNLEAEGSSAGIVRRLIWRVKSGDDSRLLETGSADFTAITLDRIFQAAREGDGVSISVIRDAVKYLAMAVSNMAAVVDPELIVVGGMLVTAEDLLLDTFKQECSRRMPPAIFARAKIELSTLGSDSAPLGAARFAQFGPAVA
jgi:predicted NBD/HSP70 family sugar kinase